jgi:hypothetical protein
VSIYRYRTGRADHEDVHEPLVAPATPNAQTSAGDSFAESEHWLQHRKAKPIDRLLPLCERWLGRLPSDVYPRELAARYPRIVNLIASQWDDAAACTAYFDGLLVDRRGVRQGFPASVRRELVKLREHWYIQKVLSQA